MFVLFYWKLRIILQSTRFCTYSLSLDLFVLFNRIKGNIYTSYRYVLGSSTCFTIFYLHVELAHRTRIFFRQDGIKTLMCSFLSRHSCLPIDPSAPSNHDTFYRRIFSSRSTRLPFSSRSFLSACLTCRRPCSVLCKRPRCTLSQCSDNF